MPKQKRKDTTIIDIAKELNVSKSTVSRALQHHPRISAETTARVFDLVKKYNYQPNAIAASLSKQRTKTIGVIVPILSHYFFSTAIAGIEEVAYKEGYKVMIFQSAESYDREVEITHTLLKSKVDGVLISISKETKDVEHLMEFTKRNIPLIFFDRMPQGIEADYVIVDDYKGAYIATEHLINQGFKSIMHLAGPSSLLISQNRMKGYLDALKDNHIVPKKNWILESGLERKHGKESAQKLLKTKLPEAIFAVSDPVAIGLMIELKENGIKLPEQMAIVGFNDDPLATVIDPQLTTIVQPAFDMGETAAMLCLDHIRNKNYRTHKIFEPRLVIRKSSIKISLD
jgi:DNA-binding LacI/PurR family transcriptional regulator